MFKKDKEPEGRKRVPVKDDAPEDNDHAYEDSWYRSLKASAENRQSEPTEDDEEATEEPAEEDEMVEEGQA